VKRGEIVIVAAKGEYTGKPRPALVVQSDLFAETASVTLCLMTTDLIDAPLIRIDVDPSHQNGLRVKSQIMVDKILTVHRDRIAKTVGAMDDATILRVDRSLVVFLGIIKPPGRRPVARKARSRARKR
jgi:mRNA interferase MazF